MNSEDSTIDNSKQIWNISPDVAERIFNHYKPNGRGVDPFMTPNTFYRFMKDGDRDWCNGLESKRDFNTYRAKCDYVMGVPPFGLMSECLVHAMSIADRVVLVCTLNHVFERKNIEAISDMGFYIHDVVILSNCKNLPRTAFPICVANYKKGRFNHSLCAFSFDEGAVCQPTLGIII